MKNSKALDCIGYVDAEFIEKAENYTTKKKRSGWIKWSSLAACLCLIVVGAFSMFSSNHTNTIQKWSMGYPAESYFKYCLAVPEGSSSTGSLADSAIPYAQSRYFSDKRDVLEANGVIPVISTHPEFTFAVRYNLDGSVYCVELLWSRRNAEGLNDYSDLKVVAGYEEVPLINDCIAIGVDDKGHVIEPSVTVTERDGIQIVARGGTRIEKSLTYQTENGWYQISGSWNDSYEAVVDLLDWFWEHPIDFTQYPMDAGDHYTDSTLTETPDAFREYLPDFAAFGFVEETSYVYLKNGSPVHFEGHYVAHVDAEKVQNQEYYDTEEYTQMHWCILAEPGVYDLEGCLGDIHSLTQEQIFHILEKEDNKLKFMQDDLLIIVYPDDAAEAWALIESLQG